MIALDAVVMEDARRMYSFNIDGTGPPAGTRIPLFHANWDGLLPDSCDPNKSTVMTTRRIRHETADLPQIPDGLALAVAAVAVAPARPAKPVTRRFWGK